MGAFLYRPFIDSDLDLRCETNEKKSIDERYTDDEQSHRPKWSLGLIEYAHEVSAG